MMPKAETIAAKAIADALTCSERRASELLRAGQSAGLSGAYLIQCCRLARMDGPNAMMEMLDLFVREYDAAPGLPLEGAATTDSDLSRWTDFLTMLGKNLGMYSVWRKEMASVVDNRG